MSTSRFPHVLTLLTGCILLAAALSYVLPAGRYDRQEDEATGREVVVAGTFHEVEQNPVGPFQMFVAIPLGMADAASVIFLVFLIGGAFTVVDETGALRRSIGWLVRKLDGRELLVIPVIAVIFATGGVLENMQEEIIPLIPVLLILTRRVGFDAVTAVSMSAGAAFVGSAFSPINPFQVGIAQKLAELPLLSGGAFRMIFLAIALGIWIWGTMRHAARTRTEPDTADFDRAEPIGARNGVIMGLVLATFAVLTFGLLRLGWDFDQMSALFLIMGIVAGLIGGLRVTGTAEAFVKGFRSMAFAALLIGFARAIYVVLDQGVIIDTIVHGLFTPIADLPVALSALGMMVVHTAVHIPVPSVSGHAVLTMPVLVPLSDLLGMSRQVTVLAYQYGAGLCDLLTPTNGALMAILATGGVRYEQWVKFAVPLYLLVAVVGMVGIVVAVGIGLA
ncbi:MAG: YfcC family protein [Gemmatimonadetes bacterium]|nr:YfcC family protein [Gemmatimonadota bacterium]